MLKGKSEIININNSDDVCCTPAIVIAMTHIDNTHNGKAFDIDVKFRQSWQLSFIEKLVYSYKDVL